MVGVVWCATEERERRDSTSQARLVYATGMLEDDACGFDILGLFVLTCDGPLLFLDRIGECLRRVVDKNTRSSLAASSSSSEDLVAATRAKACRAAPKSSGLTLSRTCHAPKLSSLAYLRATSFG